MHEQKIIGTKVSDNVCAVHSFQKSCFLCLGCWSDAQTKLCFHRLLISSDGIGGSIDSASMQAIFGQSAPSVDVSHPARAISRTQYSMHRTLHMTGTHTHEFQRSNTLLTSLHRLLQRAAQFRAPVPNAQVTTLNPSQNINVTVQNTHGIHSKE
jgi:hypothetical protein